MKIFYAPLACSMATHITLDELDRAAEFIPVDHTTRRPADGREIHPLGMVPVLHTDDGHVLTENAAILQYLAADTELVPSDPWGRAQLQQWLSFIGTELHKAVFIPLLDKKASEGAKAYALANAAPRLSILARHLEGRDYLLDRYSVADIYLVTVLNWTQVTPIRLDGFPAVARYVKALRARPAVAQSLARETEQYLREVGAPRSQPTSTTAP
ncbi:MAG: glutathione S-transferase N-terminal domain-containing protein [Myxococcales bacterium]|nr:glutathione S-transferase N-terminal domain-containing protein [Myxococcales bacterium]